MSKTYTQAEVSKLLAEARADLEEVAAMREEVIRVQDRRIADLEAKLEKASASKPSRESLRKEFEQFFTPAGFNLTKQGVLVRLDPQLAVELRAKHCRGIFEGN